MTSHPQTDNRATYSPLLFWLSLGAFIWSVALLSAGGITTSLRAGMAFLDWPLSNGSINPEGWLQDPEMMAEHSHRLLATGMGLWTIGLCIAAYACGAIAMLRKMSLYLIAIVVLQGLLGGLRVLLDQLNLNIDHNLYAESFAVAHAILGQLTFCLLAAFALTSSRSWIERQAGFERPVSATVRRWGLIACATLVLQLALGAVVRHSHAALAIPTFPLTPYGTLIPPAFDFRIAVNFAHRVGAIVVTAAILVFVVKCWRDPSARQTLGNWAWVLLGLLVAQILLGAWTIWSVRHPHVATLHMLNGAFALATGWMMTYRSYFFEINRRAGHAFTSDLPAPRHDQSRRSPLGQTVRA